MTFSEAWLAEYQAKLAKTAAIAPMRAVGDRIEFTLPQPFMLLNVYLRRPWTARKTYQRKLCGLIAKATVHCRGMEPWDKATLSIIRYSTRLPDQDGLAPKALIDCLVVRSARHPEGLGLIVDDSPAHLTLDVRAVKCKQIEQRTSVIIQKGMM